LGSDSSDCAVIVEGSQYSGDGVPAKSSDAKYVNGVANGH
jgi:hypothetical protein